MEVKYVAWRHAYLRSSPEGLYCFYNGGGDNGDAITCSEAHGYAMLISVLHRNQPDFDGLLRFFLTFRNPRGLMKWQVRSAHGRLYVQEDGATSATDGDIDIATALVHAAQLWTHGGPAFPADAYATEAHSLIAAVLAHEIHPTLNTPLLGDWANPDSPRLYNATRSSDFILAAFFLFEAFTGTHKWRTVIESTLQACLQIYAQSPDVALIPDFLEYSFDDKTWRAADGKLLESENDGHVSWNACRTPWRLAHYFAVSRDERILPLLQRMHQTLREGTFPCTPAGINMWNGEALVNYTDRAFIAPTGYLCYVLDDTEGHRACVQALLHQAPSYFGDSIDLVIAEQAIAAET